MTRGTDTEMLARAEVDGRGPQMAETTLERATAQLREANLVGLAMHGDTDAFGELARARLDHAFRLAVAILRSEADARDAVQEAFLAAWQHLPTLRDPGRFDAWLDRIVVNACRMALRHRHFVHVREIDVGDPARRATPADHRLEPGPDDGVADADLVRRAMERLDVDKRAILVLHHVEDRSIDEIAAVLGVPAGTVKWRLHAARGALQRALEEESR